jgi:hypothetical protein
MRIGKMPLPTELALTFLGAKLNQPTPLTLATLPARRMIVVVVVLDGAEADVETLSLLEILLLPPLARAMRVTVANLRVARTEEDEDLPHLAAGALTRIPPRKTTRAPTLWKIQCRKVVFGMRKDRSVKGKIVGLVSARAAGNIALLKTAAMIDPTALTLNTRTLWLPLNIFMRYGPVARRPSCAPRPLPLPPRVMAWMVTLDYLAHHGLANRGPPLHAMKWALFELLVRLLFGKL